MWVSKYASGQTTRQTNIQTRWSQYFTPLPAAKKNDVRTIRTLKLRGPQVQLPTKHRPSEQQNAVYLTHLSPVAMRRQAHGANLATELYSPEDALLRTPETVVSAAVGSSPQGGGGGRLPERLWHWAMQLLGRCFAQLNFHAIGQWWASNTTTNFFFTTWK